MTSDERFRKIESYGAAHDLFGRGALARFPRAMWHYRPAPDRWTIHEIVVHITDSEANSYIRCRRLLAEPGSAVLGYDEARWAHEPAITIRASRRRWSFQGLRRASSC